MKYYLLFQVLKKKYGEQRKRGQRQERYLENTTCDERLKKIVLFSSREENAMGGVRMDFYVHRDMLRKSIEQSVLHNHGR